jgi:hypothetical protein
MKHRPIGAKGAEMTTHRKTPTHGRIEEIAREAAKRVGRQPDLDARAETIYQAIMRALKDQ